MSDRADGAVWERSDTCSWLKLPLLHPGDGEDLPHEPHPLVYVCARLPIVGGFHWEAFPPGRRIRSGDEPTQERAEQAGEAAFDAAKTDAPDPATKCHLFAPALREWERVVAIEAKCSKEREEHTNLRIEVERLREMVGAACQFYMGNSTYICRVPGGWEVFDCSSGVEEYPRLCRDGTWARYVEGDDVAAWLDRSRWPTLDAAWDALSRAREEAGR